MRQFSKPKLQLWIDANEGAKEDLLCNYEPKFKDHRSEIYPIEKTFEDVSANRVDSASEHDFGLGFEGLECVGRHSEGKAAVPAADSVFVFTPSEFEN